jgi:uncharacterized UPF0160 family protein
MISLPNGRYFWRYFMRVITKERRFCAVEAMTYAIIKASANAKGYAVDLQRMPDDAQAIKVCCMPQGVALECGKIWRPKSSLFDSHSVSIALPRRGPDDPGGPAQMSPTLKTAAEAKALRCVPTMQEVIKGVPWSCLGAYWDHYGVNDIRNMRNYLEPHIITRVHRMVAENICVPMDAGYHRVGLSAYHAFDAIHEFRLQDAIEVWNPRDEVGPTAADYTVAFKAVAEGFLIPMFDNYLSEVVEVAKAEDLVSAVCKTMADPSILIVEQPKRDAAIINRAIHNSKEGELKKIQMVVAPTVDGAWATHTVSYLPFSAQPRAFLPTLWCGKSGEELKEAMKFQQDENDVVADAIMCTPDGNTVTFNSRESAIKAARFALTGKWAPVVPRTDIKVVTGLNPGVVPLPGPVYGGAATAVAERKAAETASSTTAVQPPPLPEAAAAVAVKPPPAAEREPIPMPTKPMNSAWKGKKRR